VKGSGADECYNAFDVIPRAGYRKTEVRLSVIDPDTLDYDKGTCNDIIVKVRWRSDIVISFYEFSYAAKAEITRIY
jgi:hypothetical protein